MTRTKKLTLGALLVGIPGFFAIVEGPVIWTYLITMPEAKFVAREQNRQAGLVWMGPTDPVPYGGDRRVLRSGPHRGKPHGPFHYEYPDGSSIRGEYRQGRRAGVWAAASASGERLWTGVPTSFFEEEKTAVVTLRGLTLETERHRWRVVDCAPVHQWTHVPRHLLKEKEFLVVSESGDSRVVGVGFMGEPAPHIIRVGHSFEFQRDGTLVSIRQVGAEGFEGLWTWFDSMEMVKEQMVFFEGEEKDHRTSAPWYDVRRALDPHQPILHPETGQYVE